MKRNLFILAVFITSLASAQPTPLFRIADQQKIGFINQQGTVVIKPDYLAAGNFSEGMAPVRLGGLYGYIDSAGRFAIDAQYDYADAFEHGIARVFRDGKSYFINKTNKVILDTAYAAIHFVNNHLATVSTRNHRKGLLNVRTGKLLIDTIFSQIDAFSNGHARAITFDTKQADRQFAIIDTSGNFIVPPGRYTTIEEIVNGYAKASVRTAEGKFRNMVIDERGKEMFEQTGVHQSYVTGDFHDGLAVISLYKYWIPEDTGLFRYRPKNYQGYVDLTGQVVNDDTTTWFAYDFSNRRAFVRDEDHRYRLIDTRFHQVGSDTFESAAETGFRHIYAIVKKDSHYGIIDTNGIFIVKPTFALIRQGGFNDSLFFFTDEEEDEDVQRYGIASLTGRRILEPVMQSLDDSGFHNGLLAATINDKLCYVNTNGKIVWQEGESAIPALRDLNIDYMNRGCFYAFSKLPKGSSVEEVDKRNRPEPIRSSENYPENALSVIVFPELTDTLEDNYRGIKVKVVNTTKKPVKFEAQDHRLYMKVQARKQDGLWADIEYLPSSWCGNSYHTVSLDKNSFWTFNTPVYEGMYKTKLRIALTYVIKEQVEKNDESYSGEVYSNEYDGSINPGQFWNKVSYTPGGIMDPYLD
jgi:hypothetical protein